MAQFIKSLFKSENRPATLWINIAASQTIKQGDLIQINATSHLGEAAVSASATIAGIADADITTGASPVAGVDQIPVTLVRGEVVRIAYIGTTKPTLAPADLYTTKFDLSDKKTLNLDDTTDGMCQVIAYDNTKKTADVVIATDNQFLQ